YLGLPLRIELHANHPGWLVGLQALCVGRGTQWHLILGRRPVDPKRLGAQTKTWQQLQQSWTLQVHCQATLTMTPCPRAQPKGQQPRQKPIDSDTTQQPARP